VGLSQTHGIKKTVLEIKGNIHNGYGKYTNVIFQILLLSNTNKNGRDD
jgi:hypothetical protein